MFGLSRILCVEAHPDDFLLGCGGTLSRIKRENPKASIWSVYFCPCIEDPNNIGNLAEHQESCDWIGVEEIIRNNFKRNIIENDKQALRDVLYSLKDKFNPDLVFTHSLNDWHNDHFAVAETSLNTFRNTALCLSYESPSIKPEFTPKLYVNLMPSDVANKLSALSRWKSQYKARPYFFSDDIFNAQLRFRGSQIRQHYAECFEVTGKV